MKKEQEIKYEFAVKDLYKGLTAESAGKELERIRQERGSVEPGIIVEESRDENSVLHNVFCWDDNKAAALYREQQAKNLLRNIKIIVVSKKIETSVRAYVHVRKSADVGRTYEPLHEVIQNDEAYKDLIEQSKTDMESFVTKYSQIEELNSVKAEMLKVLGTL